MYTKVFANAPRFFKITEQEKKEKDKTIKKLIRNYGGKLSEWEKKQILKAVNFYAYMKITQ